MTEYIFQASIMNLPSLAITFKKRKNSSIRHRHPITESRSTRTEDLRRSSKTAYAGALDRDNNGQWLQGHLMNINVCSILQAELWGTLDGLVLAQNLGSRHVILEMDSALTIQVLNKVLNNKVIPVNANSNLILCYQGLAHKRLNYQDTTCLSQRKSVCRLFGESGL